MAFSYSGDPSTSPKDGVRFLVEDTNAQDPQLNDAEIQFLLNQYTNIFKAAAYAARSIMSKYARQVDKSVGDLRLSYSQRQKAYQEMFEDLLRQAANRTSLPWVGGISHAERQTAELDTDLVKPKFTKDAFEYRGGMAGQDDGGIGGRDSD